MSTLFPDKCLQVSGKYAVNDLGLTGHVEYRRLSRLPKEKEKRDCPDSLNEKSRKILFERLQYELSKSYKISRSRHTNGVISVKLPALKKVLVGVLEDRVVVSNNGTRARYDRDPIEVTDIMNENQTKEFKEVLRSVHSVLETFDEKLK